MENVFLEIDEQKCAVLRAFEDACSKNGRLKVLCVVDNPMIEYYVKMLIKHTCYSLRVVDKAMDAMSAMQSEKANMVIVDDIMPDMSAGQFVGEFTVLWPSVPVMVFTPEGSWSDRHEIKPFRILSKPMVIDEVVDGINDASRETGRSAARKTPKSRGGKKRV